MVVTSLVLQGIDLNPMIFMIMIMDIDSVFGSCRVCFFADDTKIMKLIKKSKEFSILQGRFCNLSSWEETNNILFNNNNFTHLRYAKSLVVKIQNGK